MKQQWMVFVSLILSGSMAFAAIDLSRYQLTEEQQALIRRLEARGVAQDVIEKFAETLSRRNTQPAPQGPHIPEHTLEDLIQVAAWAEGGAFYAFAQYAGVKFDQPAYMADCPNAPLFYFGKATGTEFLRLDVMNRYFSVVHGLQVAYGKDPQNFRATFLRAAQVSNMTKYLSNEDGTPIE